MIRIRTVKPLARFNVQLGFSDGSVRTVDLEPFLEGPVFEPLKTDPKLFSAVNVDPDLGTIVWPNGADLCPDVLHEVGLGESRQLVNEARK